MSENPLIATLKSRIPGETFRLPSQGLFYTNGELADDVKNGEVHVYPMSVMDEIYMKTPDKLYSGEAITDVFKHCIPQILKPQELLSKDVDYLLVCLKILSHGDIITLEYTHTCKSAKPHEYKFSLRDILSTTKQIDPTTLSSKYVVEMENGQKVKLRPPLIRDILGLYRTSRERKNNVDPSTGRVKEESLLEINLSLLRMLAGMIISVDQVNDPEMIAEWLQEIKQDWVNKLNDQARAVGEWGINPMVEIKCLDCKKKLEIEVPINPISFFM